MPRRQKLAGPLALLLTVAAARAADPLRAGFAAPPDAAKPQTWWHWMNGNVTKAGITADLEAMRQAPSWVPTVDGDGRPAVRSWADGRFTLGTSDGRDLFAVVDHLPAPRDVPGPWVLAFPPGGGAPPTWR